VYLTLYELIAVRTNCVDAEGFQLAGIDVHVSDVGHGLVLLGGLYDNNQPSV
jgi:hypothetical protein